MEEIEIHDGCQEGEHDIRNFQYLDVVGSIETLPESFYMNDGQLQDQQKEGWFFGCVMYSNSQGSNLMNFLEGSTTRSKGSEMCEYAVKNGLLDPKSGTWIINGPKVGTRMGYLDGYAEIFTLDEIKHSIANKRPVQCGSDKIDWHSAILDNGWTVYGGKGYGHSIILDGYDDNRGDHGQFRIKQSYARWDNGHQYIDYDVAMSLLFPTRFSLIDKTETIITDYKIRNAKAIAELKAKYAESNPEIHFNEKVIKEYQDRLLNK